MLLYFSSVSGLQCRGTSDAKGVFFLLLFHILEPLLLLKGKEVLKSVLFYLQKKMQRNLPEKMYKNNITTKPEEMI